MRYLLLGLLLLNGVVGLFTVLERARPVDDGHSASSSGVELDLLSEVTTRPGMQPSVTIQQASTQKTPGAGGVSESATSATASTESESELRTCLVFGPLTDEAEVEEIRRLLLAYQLPVEQSMSRADGQTDYWVIVPPFESREAAVAAVATLKQFRVEDSFLISQGPQKNGVSLGLFKSRETATQLADDRSESGFQIEVLALERSKGEYRLTVREQIPPVRRKEILALMAARDPPVEHKQIICK